MSQPPPALYRSQARSERGETFCMDKNMKTHQCPHCGEAAISTWRKITLGYACPATCKSCGKMVGIPFWSTLPMLFFIAGIIFIPNMTESPRTTAYSLFFVALVFCTVWQYFVPLIKK